MKPHQPCYGPALLSPEQRENARLLGCIAEARRHLASGRMDLALTALGQAQAIPETGSGVELSLSAALAGFDRQFAKVAASYQIMAAYVAAVPAPQPGNPGNCELTVKGHPNVVAAVGKVFQAAQAGAMTRRIVRPPGF